MKKILAILLTLLLLLNIPVSASAIEVPIVFSGSDVPVVALFGDGEAICDEEGNVLFKFSEILNLFNGSDEENGEESDNSTMEAVINILQPFLVDGILFDKWDGYYEALEKEIGDLFTEVRFDKNGECPNNTDIAPYLKDVMADKMKTDYKAINGSYYVYDYQFWYDWRHDPFKTADDFHYYIEEIKKTTGCDKVAILARCLGTTVTMAYIAKYGTDSIYGVAFNGAVIEGAEIISESISGKFTIDAEAINRLIGDLSATGTLNLDNFVSSSIDLAIKSGLIGTVTETVKNTIYSKVVKGVTSALALSTFFTWPGYWACVSKDDYTNAIEYVFGDENSSKRTEYAGLIEKIDKYHNEVQMALPSLYDEIENSGAKIGVIAKYGFQLAPICKSSDQIADQYATLTKASFGATTADTIFDTFSDEYIEQRKAEDKDKYISPDKMVDASTCRFPDYTWFTKNISHSYWHDFETALLYKVITADTQYTVEDFDCTQFMVHNNETGEIFPMTEENCHTESWYKEGKPAESFIGKFIAFFRALINWFKALLGRL